MLAVVTVATVVVYAQTMPTVSGIAPCSSLVAEF